jgi:exosortase D (VPLPA-CTERM-specific)
MKIENLSTKSFCIDQSDILFLLFAIEIFLLFFIFFDSLAFMVYWWHRPEYSHGYMIPVVAIFLVWQQINKLPAAMEFGSWWGVVLLITGLIARTLGELSSIYTIIQYGFLISLAGIALAFFGRGMRLLWVPFVYLIFMITLPNFLYFNLSSQLKLLSSEIGVAIIRLFGVPVYLEGNVIDLGAMQLQVAEACSGLRYLFPLMSFGFLIAYLYKGPVWQRVILFLSTIPMTIFMNSFRIALIGITVDRWGIAMAEGFLHDFEGWMVFMGCILLLFFEISCFHWMNRDRVGMLDRLQLDIPKLSVKWADFQLDWRRQRPFIAALLLLVVATPWLAVLNEREEYVPARESLQQFPLFYKNWSGHQLKLEQNVLKTLKLSDYIQADYRSGGADIPVNFYVAWYSSQKKGASIHSPRSCIPGGGWRIKNLQQRTITSVLRVGNVPLRVNRALIQKGDVSQVVYYWFEGRGRDITNEYLAKWYIFLDSLMRGRSDGALIRVVTYVPDPLQINAADRRLTQFIQDFYPILPAYTP